MLNAKHKPEYAAKVIREIAKRSNLGTDLSDDLLNALYRQAEKLLESEVGRHAGRGPSEKELWDIVCENSIVLTETDYLRAAVVALSLADRLAGTDFGTSRQRSFGQKWSDIIQGLLGEIAFRKVIEVYTGGRLIPIPDVGDLNLDEALKTDIRWVVAERNQRRQLQKQISIKTTKLNGRWLDVPYRQYLHSDIYVLVKVGTAQDTLYAFLAKRMLLSKIVSSHLELPDVLFEKEKEAGKKALENIKRLAEQPTLFLAFISGWKSKKELESSFHATDHNAASTQAKKVKVYSGCGRIPPSPRGRDIGGIPLDKAEAEVLFDPIGRFSNTSRSICSVDKLEKDLSGLIPILESWVC